MRGRPGQPRKRPESVLADRAYDHDTYRRLVRYERRADIHHALLALRCCLVWFRRLRSSA